MAAARRLGRAAAAVSPAGGSMADLLRMEQITKRFGPVTANDGISLEVAEGEVHALLGENGAGKTTLMNILFGLSRPDAGTIAIQGRRAEIASPRVAMRLGIGMVHQHFMLIPAFTVMENLVLGVDMWRRWARPEARSRRSVEALAARYGLSIDFDARVADLPLGMQQRVEILKALSRGARLLVLDEPTAVLTPQEVQQLLANVRRLVAQGLAIIFITHKLGEVMAFSDRVTVLRGGRVAGRLRTAETDPATLARLMVGREVVPRLDKAPARQGPPVLRVNDLWVDDERGVPALRGVSFEVGPGEIFGIAGVDGNGQRELAGAVYGLSRVRRGSIRFLDREVAALPTMARQGLGIRHVPADRGRAGLVKDFTVMENLVLEDVATFARRGLIRWHEVARHAERLMAEYAVRAPGPRAPIAVLSGGNQQKVILARAMARTPRLLIVSQPTRGLDVGATEYVRGRLLACRDAGAAVLLISTELDEVLGISDHIGVLSRGEMMGILPQVEADRETIGAMMAGTRPEALRAAPPAAGAARGGLAAGGTP
jgi:simple sugar transport system ATP-binding protein